MSEEKTPRRFHIKTFTILLIIAAGFYFGYIGPTFLRPIQPVVVLPPEGIGLNIFGFEITNSILATLIADLILILIALLSVQRFVRKGNLVPGGFYNGFEAIVEYLWGNVRDSAGKWAVRIFPIPATIFLLIFTANLVKLVPGFESIGRLEQVHKGTGYAPVQVLKLGSFSIFGMDKGRPVAAVETSETSGEAEPVTGESKEALCTACELVPFLRGSATDINFPFALAIVTVVLTQVYGVWALGGSYFLKFFPVKELLYGGIFGLINFLVGLLELILEMAKILSFGFRLFGNIFAGALLLSILGSLVTFGLPAGLYLFEVFFGIIQAFVFYLLATIFISGATVSHHAEGH